MNNLVKINRNFVPSSNLFFDDALMRDLFDWGNKSTTNYYPPTNIWEDNERYVLELAAPGYSRENFHVEVNDELLKVSTVIDSEETEQRKYKSKEFTNHVFKRSYILPKDEIDFEQIQAEYTNGVLTVTLPKTQVKATLNKTIEIK